MGGWHYGSGSNGERQGPVTWQELQQFAASGTLRRDDAVWRPGESTQLAASEVPGLFPGTKPAPTPSADEPPPFPPKGARKPISGSVVAGTRGTADEPPPFPPSTVKTAPRPSMSSSGPGADRSQAVTVHNGSSPQPPPAVLLTPLSIPKSVADAMTVAVLLPFLLSTAGTLGVCSAPAFWLSFVQDGFALFACVATRCRTKLYWLSVMASVLTLTSWFWLSFTVLPTGLVFVGTVASIGIGTWSFVVIRKPEVRLGFGSQFDPVDWLGQIVLPRLPAFKIAPTPGNINRALVLSLSGLCLVCVPIGGILQDRDEKQKAKEYQAETLANKTKRIHEITEKVQTALTQFDANKDMAADALYDASGEGYYSDALDQVAGTLTADQQQKLFQLKQMIQPRIDKRRAEAEEWLRKSREEREKREAAKNVPTQNAEEGANGSDEESITFGVVNDADDVVSAFANEAAALQYVGKRVKIQGKVVQVEQDYTSSSVFARKQYAIVLGGHPGPNGYTTWVKCFVSNANGAASVRVGGRVWIWGTVQNGNATEVRLTDCEVLEQW